MGRPSAAVWICLAFILASCAGDGAGKSGSTGGHASYIEFVNDACRQADRMVQAKAPSGLTSAQLAKRVSALVAGLKYIEGRARARPVPQPVRADVRLALRLSRSGARAYRALAPSLRAVRPRTARPTTTQERRLSEIDGLLEKAGVKWVEAGASVECALRV